MTTKRLTNIPLLINRVVAGLNNLTVRDLTDDHRYGHAHPADAGPSSHDVGQTCNGKNWL